MNLSDWASYDLRRADHKLEEICEEIEKGAMPPSAYLLIHPSAKLSDADKKTLCDWANAERERIKQSATVESQ
jgi:hypothetical protein